MSLNHRVGKSVVRALATSAAFALVACMAPRSVRAQEPWVAPERAAHRANPTTSTPDAVKHGRELFERECLKCHGKLGHGDGAQAQFLEIKPQDLTKEAVMSQSDGALFWKITEGRGPMPKAKLSEAEKWMVIHYLRALPQKK